MTKAEAQASLKESGVKLGLYKHTDSGGLYVVFATSLKEDTLEELVTYYSIESMTRWTRTSDDFFGGATSKTGEPRFRFVRPANPAELFACLPIDMKYPLT